ncbi:MAG TPA: hypothetical protein VL171_00300 [Verrucomicrobiae bacterium]|nr:hypothetical protein [Verrucomicrobiae bacterium]
MKIVKVLWGLILFGALIVVVQLAEPPQDSPAVRFQRLPDVSVLHTAHAMWAGRQAGPALLLMDYVIENHLPDASEATDARQKIFAQLAVDNTPVSRLKAVGWSAVLAGGNSFDNLAGNTVADAVSYGEIVEIARQGGFEGYQDDFTDALNHILGMATVFPPAESAILLAKAARRSGAINPSLTKQLRQMLTLIQTDPKSALSVEKFKDNFMPMFELAKHCRTWSEFETILQQADSTDQLRVLTKMASISPSAAKQLGQVLAITSQEGKPTVSACLDHILHQGPRGLETLHAAIGKGTAGLKFVTENPGLQPQNMTRNAHPKGALAALQDHYQSVRYAYGGIVTAGKYLVIAVLCGLLVLVVIPGRYLEKLIARPGGPVAAPGAIHYFLSALAVGVVLSGLIYVLSLAMRPVAQSSTTVAAATGESGMPAMTEATDNAFLSEFVVVMSLAIHVIVWFFVRGKIRVVEDKESEPAALRLKRIENLDIFLDLPLFTGLALTVIALILIALNAGMSRLFAYTATVVGILSAVSLRIRYVFPLKERLIQVKQP